MPTELFVEIELNPTQLAKLLSVLDDHCDRGPASEGWQSSELLELIANIKEQLEHQGRD